jgi:deoxyribodipyrimidine photolyase-related protein
MNFLILPNTLFELKYFKEVFNLVENYNNCNFIIYEHPVYFGFREKRLNLNNLKLMFHRASMKYYEDYLINKLKRKNIKITYVKYNESIKNAVNKINDKVYMFDPVDREVLKDLNNKFKNLNVLETPNFLTSNEKLIEYSSSRNNFSHSHFYKWQLKRLKINGISKSYDKENRKSLPNGLKVPTEFPKLGINDNKYIKESISYTKKIKTKNYLNNTELNFPVTHKTSKQWFNNFLNQRFKYFGDYQDAITKRSNIVFHSLLSPMINIGLLNPDYILRKIQEYVKKHKFHKNKFGINDYEAFIRQLIGWREYQRLIYITKYDQIINSNFFKNEKKLSKAWYEGTTGIPILDDSIKTGFKTGYLHHIIRLMVISNFMNLCGIKPYEAYKWFMEFSIDSYDWVMIGNVYSMGMWADKGITMRKPYISSSNYILKMSDYSKGDWVKIWDSLYYNFIDKHKKFFNKTLYKSSLKNVTKEHKLISKEFINTL